MKKQVRLGRLNWLMPVLLALPLLAIAAAIMLLWGDQIRDLIIIAVKLVVIS